MVVLRFGVTNVGPVAIALPPVATSNQLMVPALAVALRVTVPAPHRPEGVVPVMIGVGLAAALTATRGEAQTPSVAST